MDDTTPPPQRVAFVGDESLGRQLGSFFDEDDAKFYSASSIDDLLPSAHPNIAIVGQSGSELATTIDRSITNWPRATFLLAPPATDADLITTTHRLGPSVHHRFFGPGTSPISLRLAASLSTRLGVSPASLSIETAGSTAAQVIPLWSAARAGGVPLHLFKAKGKRPITVQERSRLSQEAMDESGEPGKQIQAMSLYCAARALLLHDGSILSISSVQTSLAGEPIEPAVFSFPTVFGPDGVVRVLDEWPLNPAELAGLQSVAEQNRL